MNTLHEDWEALRLREQAIRDARTLPERFEAVLAHGGEAGRFVREHSVELEALIRAAAWRRAA